MDPNMVISSIYETAKHYQRSIGMVTDENDFSIFSTAMLPA